MSGQPRVHSAKELAVRRGIRAGIALPAVLAGVDAVSGDIVAALFAAFAAFALLAMADFGGPPVARASAYLTATVLSAVLITIGTLVSGDVVLSGIVTLVVVFAVLQVAAFGGAWASGMFPTTLAYVLATTLPAPASEIPTRLWGWGIGGLVATALALLLLPVYERPALWSLAADALRAAARSVRAGGAPAARADAQQAVAALHTAYAKAPYRPSGPTERDRAFVAMVEGLQRLVALDPEHPPDPGDERARGLREATGELLDAAADYATEPGATVPELARLDEARKDHRRALGAHAAAELRAGTAPETVLVDVESAWWTRVVSFVAIALAADTVIGRGGKPTTDELAITLQTPVDAGRTRWERLRRLLRINLDLGSIRFRNSVRTAVGLALAVFIANALTLDHAFWVGLATLSVLRSNALATGRTAAQAIGGTALGFVFVLVFFGVFDAGTTAEWVLLPIAAFLAAYAPSAISFLVGQFSFTVAIVLMFDVIEPEGWQTGLVRVEDIAIGAGVSLLVGVLLWPRGAIGMLRRVIGAHLTADADYLEAATCLVVDIDPKGPDHETCRHRASDAARRAGDAFDELLATPGTPPPGHQVWGSLAAASRRIQAAADLLSAQVEIGFVVRGFPEAAGTLGAESARLAAVLRADAGDLLAGAPTAPAPRDVADDRRAAEVTTLREWGGDEARVSSALGVVWATEGLHAAHEAADQVAATIDTLAAT